MSMFQRFWDYTKNHPFIIGGAVVGVIVLWYLLAASSKKTTTSTATDSYTPTTDPAVTQAEADKSIAQTKANTDLSVAKLEYGYLSDALTASSKDTQATLDSYLAAIKDTNASTTAAATAKSASDIAASESATAIAGFKAETDQTSSILDALTKITDVYNTDWSQGYNQIAGTGASATGNTTIQTALSTSSKSTSKYSSSEVSDLIKTFADKFPQPKIKNLAAKDSST